MEISGSSGAPKMALMGTESTPTSMMFGNTTLRFRSGGGWREAIACPGVAQMDVSFAPHRPYSALIKNRPRTILQAAFLFATVVMTWMKAPLIFSMDFDPFDDLIQFPRRDDLAFFD